MDQNKESVIKFYRKSVVNKPDYFEFSNFYLSEFIIDEFVYLSVEHYINCEKFNYFDGNNETCIKPENYSNTLKYYNLIKNCDSPMKARSLGTQKVNKLGENWLINKNMPELGKVNENIRLYKGLVSIRPDWNDVKNNIMYYGLYEKFIQNPKLKKLLLETGDSEIIDDSPTEPYWGIAGVGYVTRDNNFLGKLLCEVRENIRNE